MTELVTVEFLGSLSAMAAVSSLIVQVLKGQLGINPQWLNLVVAFLVSAVYTLVLQGDYSSDAISLMLINGFVITSASTGAYEYILKPLAKTMG